jgi:hypothetical protein
VGKSAVFCWVPSHTGLPGNEGAREAAACEILQSERAPGSDICAQLRRAVFSWQDEWIATQKNIWRAVKPSIEVWYCFISSIREEEVLLAGLRIEHTRLTHGHLLRGDPTPLCVHCGLPLAISHILLECAHYDKDCRTFHF